MVLYSVAAKPNKFIKIAKVHRSALNRGRDGSCSAAIASVCVTSESIRIVTSVCATSSRTFTEISKSIKIEIIENLIILKRNYDFAYSIVTAVALKKFQGVFHLLVVERELKPFGLVNATSPAWASYGSGGYFSLHDPQIREGLDYHTLTWENRSVNLDTVEAPAGKVVTGVRFRVIDGALTLQVRATDFDFTAGRLINLDSTFWYTSPRKQRTELFLENPDVPTNSRDKSIPNILPDRFIKFGPSDKYKDVAQTTVPFIDSQLVELHNPGPLSGVGLFHKGFIGYGGFIAPKILNYNFSPHIIEPNDN